MSTTNELVEDISITSSTLVENIILVYHSDLQKITFFTDLIRRTVEHLKGGRSCYIKLYQL